PATTALYALSLHDALPISARPHAVPHQPRRAFGAAHRRVHGGAAGGLLPVPRRLRGPGPGAGAGTVPVGGHRHRGGGAAVPGVGDRKSTRLNSSHVKISYA